jgi:chromosome segregation ATPase
MDLLPTIISSGGIGATIVGALTFLIKHEKGRGLLMKLLDRDGLDEKIQGAVGTAVSALESALNARGAELERVEQELSELRMEVRDLRTSDDRRTQRITELESELGRLSAENESLREELNRRRGGRPRRELL